MVEARNKKSIVYNFWRFGLALIVPVTIFLGGCITIKKIEQPSQGYSNTVFTTTLSASPDVTSSKGQPYLGVHIPENWTLTSPFSYTGGYTGTFIYTPERSSQLEKVWSKADYYWWVGEGDEHEVMTSGLTATVALRFQPDDRTGFYYLDYLVGKSGEDLVSDFQVSLPLTITALYGSGWKPISSHQYDAKSVTTTNISVTLVNLGEAGTDTFDLSISPPEGWQVNFSTADTVITNTGELDFLQPHLLNLELTPPPQVTPGSTVITLSAQSTMDENAVASTTVNVTFLSDQRGYALTDDNAIRVIDTLVQELVEDWDIPNGYAESLAIHPGGEYIYTTFPDNALVYPGYHALYIDDIVGGDPWFKLLAEGSTLGLVKFTCDGNRALISDRSTNKLYVLNTVAPRLPFQLGEITDLPGIVNDIALVGCGSDLAVTTHQNSDTITIIDTKDATVVKAISGLNSPEDIVITGGQRAYVANVDGAIGEVDLNNQTLIGNVDTGSTVVGQLAVSPDGKNLYFGATDRLLGRGEPSFSITFQGNTINDIEVSPDGRLLYVAHTSTLYRKSSFISIVQLDNLQIIDVIKTDKNLRKLTLFPSSPCYCWQTYLPLVSKS